MVFLMNFKKLLKSIHDNHKELKKLQCFFFHFRSRDFILSWVLQMNLILQNLKLLS